MEGTKIKVKRELTNGKWDKILKRRMIELSVADNYDEAKHEWMATGDCWWDDMGEEMPYWVLEHPYQCLCTHRIIYHFHIVNTENDIHQCVGSDHINSYLILRAIMEETGLTDDSVTDEMIQEWIDVKVESMKKTAWWNVNGESFSDMFNEVKDFDLRINMRDSGKTYFDSKLKMQRSAMKLRKASKGMYGSPTYQMASIVWRWNHPDNAKAQSNTRGYPNEKLMNDLTLFYAMLETHKLAISEKDEWIKTRLEEVEKRASEMLEKHEHQQLELEKRRLKYESKQLMVESIDESREDATFEQRCAYYGFKVFNESNGANEWERKFLSSVRLWMVRGNDPTEAQVKTLNKILNQMDGSPSPATDKQCRFLKNLGYTGDYSLLNIVSASQEITRILDERRDE